jgi:hypothetical protein
MEYKNYILLIFGIILLSPFLIAQPIYEQGKSLNLSIPCIINDAFCDGTAECRTTIINPDGIIIHNNESMLQNGSLFYISLTGQDVSVKGEYEFTVSCNQGSFQNSKTLYFITEKMSKKYGNTLFSFDFSEPIYLIGIGILLIISIGAFLFGIYVLSGAILALIGLIFLFSNINMLISLLLIVIGFVIILHK